MALGQLSMDFSALGQTLKGLHDQGAGWWVLLLSFGFGSCWGSFIQACYYRIPRGISIVHPPSSCPNCNQHLKLWDNIPVLGWLCLRGRCRYCAIKVPFRYLWVEIACGALAVVLTQLYLHSSLTGPEAGRLYAWAMLFLLLSKIDLSYGAVGFFALYILPALRGSVWILSGAQREERFVKVLAQRGWLSPDGEPKGRALLALFVPLLGFWFYQHPQLSLPNSTLQGCAGGWLLMQITRYLGKKLNGGHEALGLGDIKLVALLGYLVTWSGLLPTLGLACCCGLVLGAIHYGFKLKTALPFGPALCASAWLVMLAQCALSGPPLWLPL